MNNAITIKSGQTRKQIVNIMYTLKETTSFR